MLSARHRSGSHRCAWLLHQLAPAAFCVGLATSARAAVDPLIGDVLPFSAFYPAVLAAAFWGGYGAGMIAFVLSGVLGWTLFSPSGLDANLQTIAELASLAFFTGMAVCMAPAVQGQRARDAFRRTLLIGGILKVGSMPLERPANNVTNA